MTKEEFLEKHKNNPFIRDKCDCGNDIQLKQLKKGLPRNKMIYCSRSCAAKDKTSLEKRNKTSLERYQQTHYMKTIDGKEKFKKSMIDKYGVEWAQQSQDIKQKTIDNNIIKYGVYNPMKLKSIQDKALNQQFPYVDRSVTQYIIKRI